MTLKDCCDKATRRLQAVYSPSETGWMLRIIFEHLKGYSPVDLVIKANEEISDFIASKVDGVIDRLVKNEPIQYIFGETRFYGLRLSVTPDTLIPRPETEELVDLIVRNAADRSDLRILDVCTGSGCIAIALGRTLKFPEIDAIDISPAAISVAKKNAAELKTPVNFSVADAIRLQPPTPLYDIIVSNPPYIAERERSSMERNVLDYEPSIALFVPDDDPLQFYSPISRYAFKALKEGGKLFFEINPLFVARLRNMLENEGWAEISVTIDMQRKERFISATRPRQ